MTDTRTLTPEEFESRCTISAFDAGLPDAYRKLYEENGRLRIVRDGLRNEPERLRMVREAIEEHKEFMKHYKLEG